MTLQCVAFVCDVSLARVALACSTSEVSMNRIRLANGCHFACDLKCIVYVLY